MASQPALQRLKGHFAESGNTPEAWSALWEQDFKPWERSTSSPALIDALKSHATLQGGLRTNGTRKKALVPGCGTGHDVIVLADAGYDAVGLDGADLAIEAGVKLAEEHKQELGKNGGSAKFVKADFFASEWEKDADALSGFDLIYDYTVSQLTRSSWFMLILVVPVCFESIYASCLG
ncbi:hypothetical protein BT63DRAFT_421133 [Microthyrium microscopicum]|uniref:S-adenosyl-L-methionine-dependent methyltransferase n=1 Tax=Microthyrium microscopicum TaxID=703497 RepID=A0A6A6UND3_9PEZI|nr:hypothetical protein BT63DRAFT_421133 [Microthyrium microscopicum]